MKVPSLQIEAFYEVARVGHFTRAAENLHLTQSALSQRILNLETGLGVTLVVRDRRGLRLTEAGERLFQFCRETRSREDQLVADLRGTQSAPAGWLRIAGFSSVMWPLVIPALRDWVRGYPDLQLDFKVTEVSALENLLRRGDADIILTSEKPQSRSLRTDPVGFESNVLVESVRGCHRPNVVFDHDPEDRWSTDFMKRSGRKISDWRREYMDDIHGVMEATAAGWGRAVVPWHLVAKRKDLRVLREYKPWRTPVLLVRHKEDLPTRWMDEACRRLSERIPVLLSGTL